MKLRVLYFGIVRERLARRSDEIECAAGASVTELLALLAERDDIFSLGAGSIRVAVNREYVEGGHVLADNDEVAIIPPVAGGTSAEARRGRSMFAIVEDSISIEELSRHVASPQAGAIATFLGTTRDTNRGRRVLRLEYEAYAEMAIQEFEKIAAAARARWELTEIAIVHRIGVVPLGDASVAIAVSAPHRREAIEACHYCIDSLKLVAPIWKKEHFEGGEVWIGSLADCDHGHAGDDSNRAKTSGAHEHPR